VHRIGTQAEAEGEKNEGAKKVLHGRKTGMREEKLHGK
jgi:hypothetical protein